ncbi:MAG: hypothetical protein IJ950_08310, partial [Helicobacter sp.]|nr:hypothetical protein [Helicobacter sp.]
YVHYLKSCKTCKSLRILLFILFIASFSGLLLMFVKESTLLSYALWLHLSCIMVFFLMIPYSKFVHILYRFIALLKYNAQEEA